MPRLAAVLINRVPLRLESAAMDVLGDSSNIHMPLSDRSAKRPRLSQLEPPAASFTTIVDRAGIQRLIADANSASDSTALPGIDDPRRIKRQLSEDLAKPAAQANFLSSLSDVMANDELLRRCLLPVEVTNERCLKYATGDSFMRLLLNILPLQQRLATMLLQKLPEFSTAECDEPDGPAADSSTASLSSLILAQLRWLEVVSDPAALTSTMLEVLPVCSPSIQRQLIGILPEVAQPQDHSHVLEQLQGLLETDVTFMAPVVECLGNMMLEAAVQDEVVSSLMSQLPAVEVEDLPGLIKYIIGAASSSSAEQVLTNLRSNLHFLNPADPRLAVPDRRQKGLLHPGSKSPEALLVRELVAALQANTAASTACLKLQAGLTEPGTHGCFDLVVLLALHAKGSDSRRAVEACLKKKLVEGAATPAWLTRALTGHQACYRDQLWNSLLSLASTWCGAREAPVTAAASSLYVSLCVVFEASLERQQVLHALHGHLGSGVAGQQDVALQALCTLASRHVSILRGYSSYLANILDHLEGFNNTQLQQVFTMFAALTAKPPPAAGAGGASSGAAGGSSSSAAGGSRLEDELVITLNKALAQSNPGYKRIGIMGMLALLQQEGATYELLCDADGTAAGAVRDSWISRAESVFKQCMSHPGVFAFLLDQLSLMLEAQQQQAPKAAAAGEQGGAGDAGAAVPPAQIPAPMLDWMHEKVNDLLVEVFTAEMPNAPEASEVQATLATQAQAISVTLDDPQLKAQLWFNLDGSFAPVYLAILPLVASRDTHKRAQLAWLPAALRLLAGIANCRFGGDMTNIDALLGCPLALPDRNMFADGQWDSLPLPSRVSVLLSLQHTICWLREVVAVFAPCISTEALVATAGSENTQATMESLAATQNKLMMRLAQLRATEALFCDLAATCPAAAQQLPDLSYPLTTAAAGTGRAGLSSSSGLQGGGASGGNSKAQAAGSSSAVLALCRCLRPPAAVALNTCQPPHLLHTALLPATHLATDLHSKLKLLLKRAKTPAGLMPPPAALAGAGLASGGLFPAVMAPSGPPCLEGVELQQFVCQVVVPLLPALQQHLVMALNVIKQPPQAELDTLFDGLPGYNSPGEAAMFELPAVQAVVQAVPAAHSLALCCTQCFTLLLSCGKELPLQALHAVLAALALQPAQPAAAEPPNKQQVYQSLIAAFKACRKLSCRSSGNSSLQLELALLSLLRGLKGLGADQGMPADKVTAMAGKLSKAAAELLQESWQGPEDEAAEGEKDFSWKGQTAAISQLLCVLISQAADPSKELLSLVNDALSAMPDKVPSKEQLDPVAGFAALCSATFATWYKVVFEQTTAHWERVNSRAMTLLPSAAAQGGGQGKKKKEQIQFDSRGQPDWDAEQVEEVVQQAHRCAQSFAGLVELTKKHKTRNQLLGTALKNGGGFVDVMVKSTDFWYAYYIAYGKPFQQLVKTVQKGTKIMQAICAEGKVRGGASVVAQAPSAKRALERFVHVMHSLFLRAGEPPEAITVGFLKHRDIDGNAMPSQLFPEPEPDEDEDDDDEDMGAEEEEAYEEEGSVAGG